MDGRARSACELAGLAGVTPQTMSSHLSELVNRGLLTVEKRGRRHSYRRAGPLVARMLAAVMLVAGIGSSC
jgi:DNA-binding transcriptional ArsR family regulator